jgi:hypothetical protein
LAFHSGREADHSPPSSAEVKEWVELYLYSPNTLSWRGAQLGGAQGQFNIILRSREEFWNEKTKFIHFPFLMDLSCRTYVYVNSGTYLCYTSEYVTYKYVYHIAACIV